MIIKPPYYALLALLIIEIYFYYEVNRYVDIMMGAVLKDDSDEENDPRKKGKKILKAMPNPLEMPTDGSTEKEKFRKIWKILRKSV